MGEEKGEDRRRNQKGFQAPGGLTYSSGDKKKVN